QLASSVKEEAIKDVVDTGHVRSGQENGEGQLFLFREGANFAGLGQLVHIDANYTNARGAEFGLVVAESAQLFGTLRRQCPHMQKQWLAAEIRECARFSRQIGQRETGCGKRIEQPSGNGFGRCTRPSRGAFLLPRRGQNAERRRRKIWLSFLDRQAM